MSEMPLFSDALKTLDEALKYAKLHTDTVGVLKVPKAVHIFSLPVRMDNGSLKIFTAYRVQFSDACGPGKGGIRFHPNVNLDEVQSLGFWMAIKTAVMGLPLGGAKGGVTVDPKTLSPAELERLSRAYVNALGDLIGPEVDIPAPDVYTNETIMGWMADQYAIITRRLQPGVITGKPIALGGSLGRDDATARGGFYVLEVLRDQIGLAKAPASVAIQGFGNAGQYFAALASRAGYRIVAISDSKSGVYNDSGLDPQRLIVEKQETGRISGGKAISNADLLELGVDVLVPAALENQITEKNVANIKAKVVLELANGPTSFSADRKLFERGIVVLPDILANAGGVTVSYFEWVQNRAGYYWELSEVQEKLKKRMDAAALAVDETRSRFGCSMRTAAYVVASERIGKAIEAQGTRDYFQKR